MTTASAPVLAVTCGDPDGIGVEIALKALAAGSLPTCRPLLLGPRELWRRGLSLLSMTHRLRSWDGAPPPVLEPGTPPAEWVFHAPAAPPRSGPSLARRAETASPPSALTVAAREAVGAVGAVEIEAVVSGAELCLAGRADALVTAPIHKAALWARGYRFPGHTELLGALCGVERPVMLFAGGRLRVALLTIHIPLADVPGALTVEGTREVARVVERALRREFGIARPRLALCGLNPHAGESGQLGREEIEVLAPAARSLRAEGIELSDPLPADTVFGRALRGDFDAVLACYHDQGLAPLKAVDFGRSVNITCGLPIVRTSVDHGTARDIAWQGRAEAGSMESALQLAIRLAEARRAPSPMSALRGA